MNKLFIFFAFILTGFNSFAQHSHHAGYPASANAVNNTRSSARTTATGDTSILQNSPDTLAHTFYKYTGDTGYVYGMNYWGDMAFAEQYNVGESNNVQVIGVMALFGGKVNPANSQAITFYVWNQGLIQPITGSQYYNGFPDNMLDSFVAPITQLGIGATADTMKEYFFPAATGNLTGPFFIGYGIQYNYLSTGGDTIGLASTLNGVRNPSAIYTVDTNISETSDTTIDTIVNVQNTTMGSDHVWYDNYTQYDSLYDNLDIYPIIVTGYPVSVHGVTRQDLTFYGCYPNPCISSTNIKFALAATSDVTISVIDMAGKTCNTIKQEKLSPGQHITELNTASMPSGDYIYLVRTAAGDGLAGKMTVMHNN